MSSTIARVRYFDRQFLRLDEFVDEQAYHLAAHRRHNIGLHTWGIVSGLELATDEAGQPLVRPGFAVDGFGRDLVLDVIQGVGVAGFDELASEELAVWLVYDRLAGDPAPGGYLPCDRRGGRGEAATREQERPRVVLTVPDPDTFDPRAPETVPEDDRRFPPHRTPPDSVAQDWPVFLGRITRDARQPALPAYVVDPKGRPYAGAVAAGLTPPFDRDQPWLVLGGDAGGDGAPFRVLVPHPLEDRLEPALEIAAGGPLTAHGPVEVRGDLGIGGALELAVADPVGEASETLEGRAQPWRIYRHRQTEAVAATTTEGGGTLPGERIGEQLRIEMATDGSEVVIGHFSEDDGVFRPCLTVDSDCTVTVHGNLVVEGSLGETKPRISPGLSIEARQYLLNTFSAGVAGSNLFLAGGLLGTGGFPLARAVAAPAPPSAEAMAVALVDSPDALDALAAALRARSPVAASTLARRLAVSEDGGGGG